ncbi:MAG: hypothetical protein LBK53_01155 [Heliobacteriaceae bacterium]|jgi:predicted outer membrane repeat protein|nr:hypothetical protein [Heliobacteriaceae bacterium]
MRFRGFILLILLLHSPAVQAADVSTPADFVSAFNNSGVSQITVMNNISLTGGLNNRMNSLAVSGSTGSETLTVNGGALRFIPNWPDSLNASISNLTLYNASNGAVEMSGNGNGTNTYSITNVTFLNNANSSGNGGGSYIHAQVANTAGADYEITGSVFTQNSALNGGAVYNSSDNSSAGVNVAFSVTNSDFTGNTAVSGNGGAIYNNSNNGSPNNTFTVTGGTFSGNTALNGSGGAIFNQVFNPYGGANVFNIDGIFNNNSAQNSGAVENEVIGGAGVNTFNISGTFTGNSAANNGGAVSAFTGVTGNSPYAGSSDFNITGTFENNSAGSSGGAVYINTGRGQSTVVSNLSGDFTGNRAASGGAVYNYANNNSAQAEAEAALNITGGTNFTNNSASNGGAIYNDNQGLINLTTDAGNINFTGNTAVNLGNDIYQANSKGVINVNGNSGVLTMDGGIAGLGTINKSGSGTLELTGTSDSSGFTGVFNSTGGITEVEGVMFSGQNNITDSTLYVSSPQNNIYYNANLYDGAVLDHVSTNTSLTTLNTAPNLTSAGINLQGNDVLMNFLSGLPGSSAGTAGYARYNLTSDLSNGGTDNIVTFTNAALTLGVTDYTGTTSYLLSNTALDLAGSSADMENYTFSNLTVSDTNINFKAANSTGTIVSDTLTVNAGGGTTGINNISIYDSSGNPLTGTVQVLSGPITFNSNIPAEQYSATTNYEYVITKTPDNQGIIFSGSNPSTPDNPAPVISTDLTLDKVNMRSTTLNPDDVDITATRSFQVNSGTVYQNSDGLHNMDGGTFSVYGQTGNPQDTVLSGELTGGGSGSLFKMEGSDEGSAEFTLENLTVQNASGVSGAVLSLTDDGSEAVLNNLIVQNNAVSGGGGSIYQTAGDLTAANTIFTNNSAGTDGGAIDHEGGSLLIFNAAFEGNTADNGGAVYNTGEITIAGGAVFNGNTADTNGGAVYNSGTAELTSNQSGNIVFTNNSAGAQGNDIYNDGTLDVNGDVGSVIINGGISGEGIITKEGAGTFTLGGDNSGFTGTFTQTDGTTNAAGVFLGGSSTVNGGVLNWTDSAEKDPSSQLRVTGGNLNVTGTLNLNNANDDVATGANINIDGVVNVDGGTLNLDAGDVWNGSVALNDGNIVTDGLTRTGMYSQSGGNLFITNNSNITLGNAVTGGNITVDSSVLNSGGNTLNLTGSGGNFSVNNAGINAADGVISNNTFSGDMNVSGSTDFAIDIDARGRTSDNYVFAGGINGSGNIDVASFNLTSAPVDAEIPFIVFNGGSISDAVTFEADDNEVNTPIGVYRLYSEGGGLYVLRLLSSALNKQIFRGQAATLAMYNSQLTVNNMLFDHVYLDSNELTARNMQNRYAAGTPLFAPYQFTRNEGGLWFKTYANFEKLSMTHDLNVDNNIYGSILGADFPVITLKKGWKFLPSAYISYNGGHQTYSGVGMYQNGGQGGFMGSFSHGDFIGSVLAYGGGYNNEMSVEGFTDRTANWFAGTAVKGAYNFHPARNIIIQPSVLASYNIFGGQSWGSDFGAMSMNSGFLNGINVAPGLNIIYGRETWSLYLTTLYMYNINDKLNGSAGNINLPDISMRHGFIEYGLGATKTFKDRLMSYVQVTLRNGGRTGVALQFGLTWKM